MFNLLYDKMTPDEPLNIAQFSQVTDVLFQAALDSSKWQDFIAVLSRHTGDIKTHMFGFDRQTHQTFNLIGHGYSDEAIDVYRRHYYKKNAWAPGFANAMEGAVVHSQQMMSLELLEQTDFYHEWVKPQEDVCAGGGVMLFKGGNRTIMLGGNIRRKDADALESNWLHSLAILRPHIRQAFEFNRIIAEHELSSSLPINLRGDKSVALYVVDEKSHLSYSNAAGEKMLDTSGPAQWTLGRRFRFNLLELNALLTRATKSLLRNDREISHFLAATDQFLGPIEVRILRISPDNPLLPFPITLDRPHLLISIAKVGSNSQQYDRLAQFGLTKAEVEIVGAFCSGKTLREISQDRDVSIFTARNQIKSAMQKLGVSSQIELIKKLEQL
ncbi:hypothetical protein GCM10007879_23080 [Maritalea porphyrae]|uniref:HTH luxR-type domain-containing protein n=2 Tax=Maritalea porphyrae TaxID=880732 RepID=A0ABQ5UUJ3_9HYPH|nr:hypothetical protein GCM10007879_23080 [Maritalea porphyrae]